FNADELDAVLGSSGTVPAMVYAGYQWMLQARALSPAFHPHGSQDVLHVGDAIFALRRVSPNGTHTAICLHNVSAQKQDVDTNNLDRDLKAGIWNDLLTGHSIDFEMDKLSLESYQAAWFVSNHIKTKI
ncbi:MAG: hypothetical protein MUO76_20435, partial [Anaerolineaceae bacterium]|nr:hypothetical protein [Anaerolineaceae bacterium]